MVTAARDARPVVVVSDAVGAGGAEVYLALLAEALGDQRAFVALIGARTGERASDQLESAGARVVRIGGLGRIPRPAALRRLVGALRALDPAVVHVNATDQGDGLTAILAARAVRRPLVVTVHLALDGRAAYHETLSGRSLRWADAVIAVSDGVAAHLTGLGVSATIVRNGVPVPAADPDARRILGVDPGALLVGGIGRLGEQKGWDVLCRAAPVLRERSPGAVVVIVGDGAQHSALQTLADRHDVRLLGARANAASLLHAFDVLAMPSRFEGLPLVAMEALHAGVPIVGSDIAGVRDVVGDAGVLVSPEDPAALGAALAGLAADRAARADLGARGRARGAARFTVQRMAQETAAVYDRLADVN
ncbi:MAG: hypothetical protein QOG15_3117 [Solirubrobacteraceae bacterium]|jgi:glycosyltransferase involved in cell wall biosynthesis|nr:hypothetical protein [Solirubrobacteraceae bacterium]